MRLSRRQPRTPMGYGSLRQRPWPQRSAGDVVATVASSSSRYGLQSFQLFQPTTPARCVPNGRESRACRRAMERHQDRHRLTTCANGGTTVLRRNERSEGLPMPREPALLASAGRMPKRRQHRVSAGQDARSERPATGRGQPRAAQLSKDPTAYAVGLPDCAACRLTDAAGRLDRKTSPAASARSARS